MRHPPGRFTVRRMMMAVGFSAALLTAFEAGRRYEASPLLILQQKKLEGDSR
jgi:hypothetical protein